MADSSPAQRLAELRQRWERDPRSRIFLQLAEEYRRAGRLAEAVRVLESGLAAHPGYVAAQVVLGRCLLETGDAPRAVGVLERAVASDPTQIVAIRLLVDAYLGTENIAKARERLDLYRLLNDRDTEIESLEARIGAMGGVMKPFASRSRMSRERSGEVAIPTAPIETPAAAAAHEPKPVPLESALFPVEEVVRPRSEQPFGRLRGVADAHRIVSAIAAAGIFPVAAPRPARAPEAPTPRTEEIEAPVPPPATALESEPAPEFASEPSSDEARPSTPFAPLTALEPPPEPAPPEPEATLPSSAIAAPESAVATATLGSLYLSQGHLDDAAHSFEAVLDSRPDDPDALAGLAEVMRRKVAAAAAFIDEPAAPPAAPAVAMAGGLTSRKIELLRQFMTRLRRGSSLHVS